MKDNCSGARVFRRSMIESNTANLFGGHSNVVDVTKLGAKGDGVTDETKAFQRAWQVVCGKDSGTLHIPAGHRFLVGPLTFSGPCKQNIHFQVDGSVIASVNPEAWASKPLQWISFSELDGIIVAGKGLFDGQGASWWKLSDLDVEVSSQRGGSKLPTIRPTALRFYGSYGVSVQGITIQNSPQSHLKIDSCTSVTVANVTISSPANIPNTDGIYLENSDEVEIHHSSMACGDDCVSIQTGCTGIRVHNINCGPGHGVSIGGLGKDGAKACVSNVSVYDSNIHDASNGVRIKTWQGGIGEVKMVSFSNIQVSNVRVPIGIDQFYCEEKACRNLTSGVFISDITYEKITGTYVETPVYMACSDSVPCTNLKLINIQLQPAAANRKNPFCLNSYGEQLSSMKCLWPGRPRNDPSHTLSPEDEC
ncbi:hypothetical protein SUGI_0016780 [Cryptomeria japonica]|nr:hypothetical protein SUGI_0016780 [Cryptomeria japonica]